MQRHRYLAPRLYVALPLAAGRRFALPEAAAHHALGVLRLKDGEDVVLFNGEGGEYPARIRANGRRGAEAELGEHRAIEREARLRVTLAQGLSSNERMDTTVQKSVELGVAAIQPLACEKSVVRLPPERTAARIAHWRRVAIAACEQCGRNRVPPVLAPMRVADYRAPAGARALVLAPDATATLAAAMAGTPGEAVLAVGPEAGFSEGEEKILAAAGFVPVKLGERILRTETAGPAALAVLNSLAGEY